MAKSKLFNAETTNEMREGDMNPPAEATENNSVEEAIIDNPSTNEDEIVNIDLSVIKKKKFRINNDPNKDIELNTSDLGIGSRLDIAYKKLNSLMDEVTEAFKDMPEEESEEDTEKILSTLDKLDKEMREQVDFIFNAPVSSVCADDGSMWDPINGAFRYEHIIDVLTRLYETNINAEFAKMRSRINRKVTQYTKKKTH